MKNKQVLFLAAALSFFILSRAQNSTKQPAPAEPKAKVTYGVKANIAYVGIHKNQENDGGNTIFQNDYSLYLMYKSVGIFGGYTGTFGYNNYSTTQTTQTLNGFNVGLIFQLFQSKNKQHGFLIYLYDVHYSATNPKYPVSATSQSSAYYDIYYKEGMNFLYINPRYQYTFCNGLLSAELGVQYGAHIHDIKSKLDPNGAHFLTYNNRLQGFLVMGGINLSIACNISSLLSKK
ncbi:MAG TPA: hypothetical protein VN698_04050, partial [Bacteroidia bacterium]|nr:hypothetical protein [Bacteroidia bacterium]